MVIKNKSLTNNFVRCEKSATISKDEKYRYDLWRIWDKQKPYLMIIGLNPSTADETKDDNTIRRCKRFAFDWGFGGLCMTNLFAIRATKPKEMMKHPYPVGDANDSYLIRNARSAGMVLAAWSNDGTYMARDWEVKKMIEKITQMKCLKKTKSGNPWHPLYVKADTKPILF